MADYAKPSWSPSESRDRGEAFVLRDLDGAPVPLSRPGGSIADRYALTGGGAPLADDDANRTAAAYGNNYQRLQRVKATYDPTTCSTSTATSPQRGIESGG